MLPTHIELIGLIDDYEKKFKQEAESAGMFRKFVTRNLSNSVYSRKNFDGHFTASAFLANSTMDKVLLLHHKKLNRWLQPGGHIDDTDESILAATIRETCEETGLQQADLQLVNGFIFDLDAHEIPLNPKKDEPAHVHYDVRYMFRIADESKVAFNTGEATDMKWVTFDEVKQLNGFERVATKLERLKRI